MTPIRLAALFEMTSEMSRISTHFKTENRDIALSPETMENNAALMEAQAKHLGELSLHMCRMQCEQIATELRKGITCGAYSDLLAVLVGRLHHEPLLIRAWALTPTEFSYYEQKNPLFGDVVHSRFPSASDDIEEAGKCLAFSRGTACVMHLMRVMEVGLKALAKPLGIPYAPSWESYLRQINTKMAVEYKKKPLGWRKREPFFRDISGDLVTVKHAWRNPSMHVVRKYSPEEADEILRAVRRFMQRLADGLP
jgi:hypothetical protein